MTKTEEIIENELKINIPSWELKRPLEVSNYKRLVERTKAEVIKEIKELIRNWKDTSIKDEKIALMITNGGYIHKPTLLKEISEKFEHE